MLQTSSDDIALLALSAAYEVDLRLSGGSPCFDTFHKLGQKLSEVSFGGSYNEISFLHSDPKTIEVLAKAFEDASSREIGDVTVLSEAVKELIRPLQSTDHAFNQSELQQVKDFCIALHRALAAADLVYNHEWEQNTDGEAAFY